MSQKLKIGDAWEILWGVVIEQDVFFYLFETG
jgi:hypothetical protein